MDFVHLGMLYYAIVHLEMMSYYLSRKLGNGKCNEYCITRGCFYDAGDCAQLCFANELTNCTYDKFTNDECDQGCDNEYCMLYEWASDFEVPNQYEHNNKIWQAGNCLQLCFAYELANCTYDKLTNILLVYRFISLCGTKFN